MNITEINEALTQATQETDGSKAWRILMDLCKAIKAHHDDTHDMAEIKSETLLGQYMEKVKSKISPHQLTQAEAEKVRVSIMKRFFGNEYTQELHANNAKYQAKLAAERGEVAKAKEIAPKSTIQVNEDVEVKLVKWEGYGKKRIYIKRVGVIAKREDLGFVENGKWLAPKDIENRRYVVYEDSPEWQAVIDAAMALLK